MNQVTNQQVSQTTNKQTKVCYMHDTHAPCPGLIVYKLVCSCCTLLNLRHAFIYIGLFKYLTIIKKFSKYIENRNVKIHAR